MVLESLHSKEIHTFELMFPNEPVPALGMAMAIGIDPDELLDLTHSQMVTLLEEVKKKNTLMVQLVEKLIELGQRIIAEEIEARNEDQATPAISTFKQFH